MPTHSLRCFRLMHRTVRLILQLVTLLQIPVLCASAKTQPTWTVNPSDYEYSMQIIARLENNGNPVNVSGSLIGVFSGSSLRGFASPVTIGGTHYFYITVYSNRIFGETLKFRVYYPPDDRVYGASTTTTFLATSIKGSIPAPFVINMAPGFDFLPELTPFTPDTTLQYLDFETVNLSDNLVSEDGDPVAWSAVPGAGLNATLSEGNLQVTPAVSGWTGTDSVLITATELTTNGYSASRYMKFTVQQDYGTPILAAIPAQVITPGSTFSPIALNSYLTFNGPDYKYTYKIFPFQGTASLPDWSGIQSVSPVMKMVVRPLFNNVQLGGANSRLAVYVNNVLAGVASPSGSPPYVTYTLNIQNVASGKISFRFYDAENQYLYQKNTGLNFSARTTVGTVAVPFNLQLSPLTINLVSGDILQATVIDTSWRGAIPGDVIVVDSHYPLQRRDTSQIFYAVSALGAVPTFTSPTTVSFLENTCMQVYDAQSTSGSFSEGYGLTYSLVGGTDASKFSIHPSSGVLSWNAFTPDFENPGDSNSDNMYEVVLRSTDLLGSFSDLSLTVTVTDNTLEVVSVQITGMATICNGNATTLTASGSGTYLWSNGLGTNSSVMVMPSVTTTYTVTLTAPGGCTASASFTVTVVEMPTTFVASITQTNVSCNGLSDGSATVTASGGSMPYSYDWADTPAGDGTATITGLISGTYTVTVTDNNGCHTTAFETITEPAPLIAAITSQVHVSCHGGNDGAATASPVGGTSPYEYLWSNGQMTQTAVNLVAGTYDITITDSNGCQTTASAVTITQPAVLVITSQPFNANATVTCGTSAAIQSQFTVWNTGITYTGGAAPVSVSTNYLVVADENGSMVTKYNGPEATAPSKDGGFTTVTWTVTDNCGISVSVSRTFNVLSCSRISGKLNYYRNNAAVNGVGVKMFGPGANNGSSSGDGSYTVFSLLTGNFIVVPDSVRVCGACTTSVSATNLRNIHNISVEDVDAIKAHVAAGAQFTNIYQRAAANVVLGTPASETNNRLNSADATSLSQAINGSLVQQQRLWRRSIPRDTILTVGAPGTLPRSWGLVPPGISGVQNPSQYGDYPTRIRYNALDGAIVNQDFAVVQVGDVVAHPGSSIRDDAETRYAGLPLIWKLKDEELVTGESIEADFTIEQMQDLRGWQFGLQFDPAYLKVEMLSTSGVLSLDADVNFGLYRAEEGEIRSLWAEGMSSSLNKGESVFKLSFTVLRGGKSLSEVLKMEDDMSGSYALTDTRDQVGVMLSYVDQSKNGQSPLLYQNVPNPFKRETLIRFELPSDSPVQLSIHDITGRLVKRIEGNYSKGMHEIRFDKGDLGQYAGILYYTLSCGDFTATYKMVMID